MAHIATCPKCQKAISTPDAADAQTWVRCPLCGSQFQLHAALEIVPPSLDIIAPPNDQQPADTPTAAAPTHVPNFPTLHESPHLAEHFAAIPHSATVAQRLSQKQKNLLIELLKIVVGGMAGLVLGYAILFWGFQVDPFHFARFFPAGLVPQNLNPPAE